MSQIDDKYLNLLRSRYRQASKKEKRVYADLYGIDSTTKTIAPRKRAFTTPPSPTGPAPVMRTVEKALTPVSSHAPNVGPAA